MSRRTSAAVVGAGLCGLEAIAILKEEDFGKIICFEKSGYLGGRSRYQDDDDSDGVASVVKSTIINTNKEIGAFSNFPPPVEYPNYMHNSLMYAYIKSAAKKFDAEKHIKFFHEVQRIEKADDYKETGRWKVTSKNTQTSEIVNDVFDCVLICIGHQVCRNIPTFPGQEQFSGKIMHSHDLKKAQSFQDMRVVVVGADNSAMDAAVKLSSVAKQVYLSTRKGKWVLPSDGPHELPTESLFLRHNHLLQKILPYNVKDTLIESFVNNNYVNHTLYDSKPKHRISGQHPTTDSLPIKLLSGVVIAKSNIKTFTKNGVIFDDEENETPIDAIIICIGYKEKCLCLREDILPVKNNRIQLYKYIFPPDLPHPTLAILGQVQPVGPVIPVTEMQCRWAIRVICGKIEGARDAILTYDKRIKAPVRKESQTLSRKQKKLFNFSTIVKIQFLLPFILLFYRYFVKSNHFDFIFYILSLNFYLVSKFKCIETQNDSK